MTEQEARDFVVETIQGIWTKWTPTEMQYGTWVYMLKLFDCETSRQAIRNFVIQQEKLYNEPNIAVIRNVLIKAKQKALGEKGAQPVHLYTIIKESRIGKSHIFTMPSDKKVKVSDEGGERFYAGTPAEVPDEHEIERRAEITRKKMNHLMGENHVIKYTGPAS